LEGKPEGWRPFGIPGVCEDNTKMSFQEVGFRYMDYIDLTQDRDIWLAVVNALMNLRVP